MIKYIFHFLHHRCEYIKKMYTEAFLSFYTIQKKKILDKLLSSMRVVVASVCDVGDGAEWHCMNQTEPRTLVICLWALVL